MSKFHSEVRTRIISPLVCKAHSLLEMFLLFLHSAEQIRKQIAVIMGKGTYTWLQRKMGTKSFRSKQLLSFSAWVVIPSLSLK